MTSPKRFTIMPRLKSVLVCSTSLQSDKSTAVQSENQVLKAVGVMSLAMISSICFQISSRESIRIPVSYTHLDVYKRQLSIPTISHSALSLYMHS